MTINFSQKLPKSREERNAALRDMGFYPWAMTNQVHGDTVHAVGGDYDTRDGDAMITGRGDVYLIVRTADCVPILLHDPVAGAVGAVHSGWRGTALRIASRAVEEMSRHFGSRPQDIRAYIGPCICHECFETGLEVPERLGPEASPHIEFRGKNAHVDLRAVNGLWLRNSGVEAIEISPECTACSPDKYWSHRVHGEDRGLQANVISLR